MKLQNAKGVRDYLPQEMIQLNNIMGSLRESFEKAGYNPLTTPVIERMDVLAAKYAGGTEILKETFQFQDQGKRELGLRYDLTVPFARIIGQNPQLKLPFKRYQMEKVYRDGPLGPGRYREFWQCDIDVVGPYSMKAEAELLSIVEDFFIGQGLNPLIKINNRKILNSILDLYRIDNKIPVIMVVDKFFKLKRNELVEEMLNLGYEKKESEELFDLLEELSDESKSNMERLDACAAILKSPEGREGISELLGVLEFASAYGLRNIEFQPLLARGLNYYTGTVFEVVIKGNEIKSTVCAGGRYNKMIGDFLENKEQYPAVGLSFGLSRIFDALTSAELNSDKKTVSEVFVYSINEDIAAINIVQALRARGVNAELDLMDRKPGKNLKYAEAMDIPFVIAIGENEVREDKVSLKTPEGWKELELDEAIAVIKGSR